MATPHRTAPEPSTPPQIDQLLAQARDAPTLTAMANNLSALERVVQQRHELGMPIWFSMSARALLDKLASFELGPGTRR